MMIAYWLIPAQNQRSFFKSTICELAARFDAPVFEPHVTVYVTRQGEENPSDILGRVLVGYPAVQLSVRGIQHSEIFTQTLFVQFEPNLALTQLKRALCQASGLQDVYDLNPHLSLLYKNMAVQVKTNLSASLRLPFSKIAFDMAKAVICPPQTTSRKDVESWQVVAVQRLTA